MKNLGKANLVALAVPLALLGGAYGFQYIGGLVPCEMCWWQRYAHFAALGLAVAVIMQASNMAGGRG
jgi:disulfide bond formation protein DsbB